MDEKRSTHVIKNYKQDKLNVSVLAQMKRLLTGDEQEHRLARRFNIIAIVLAVALTALAFYIFSRLSIVTL